MLEKLLKNCGMNTNRVLNKEAIGPETWHIFKNVVAQTRRGRIVKFKMMNKSLNEELSRPQVSKTKDRESREMKSGGNELCFLGGAYKIVEIDRLI